MKKVPLTPTEKDDEAWDKIISEVLFDNSEEGKVIFLTRCAESAQEALAEGEKRMEAQYFEEAAKLICRGCQKGWPWIGDDPMNRTNHDSLGQSSNHTMPCTASVLWHRIALDALTPATQEKG